MEEIVKELDQNNDGTIEFSEFLKVMAVPKRGSAAFKLMTRVSYGSKSANCMRRQSKERRESEQKTHPWTFCLKIHRTTCSEHCVAAAMGLQRKYTALTMRRVTGFGKFEAAVVTSTRCSRCQH